MLTRVKAVAYQVFARQIDFETSAKLFLGLPSI